MSSPTTGPTAHGPRDVNGRVVQPSSWQRLRARFGGRRPDQALGVDAAGLTVLVESFDDAASSSALLDAVAWDTQRQVVLRHVLALPPEQVAHAVELAALDGYVVDGAAVNTPGGSRAGARQPAVEPGAGRDLVVLARAQQIDALHLSQERSRMASLGSRHGGVALGWQILYESESA